MNSYLKHYISIFFISFSLSWLSPAILFGLVGSNFSEPFLFIGFYLLKFTDKKLFNIISKQVFSNFILIIILYLFICLLIGLLNFNYSFSNSYADFRAILVFIITFKIFSNFEWDGSESEKTLIKILVTLTLCDLVALSIRGTVVNNDVEFIKQVISIPVPVFLVFYFLNREKFVYTLFFLIILSYEAAFSFLRAYYLIAMLSFFIYFFVILYKLITKNNSFRNNIYYIISIIFPLFSLIILFPKLINYFESDEVFTIHSINRTNEFIDEDGSNEIERINSVILVFRELYGFLLPNGLGWRSSIGYVENYYKDYLILSTMDSSFLFLAFHASIFFLIFIIFFVFNKSLKNFIFLLHSKNLSNILLFFLFQSIFLISFFTSAAMFSTPQSAFCYAFIVSTIIYFKKS